MARSTWQACILISFINFALCDQSFNEDMTSWTWGYPIAKFPQPDYPKADIIKYGLSKSLVGYPEFWLRDPVGMSEVGTPFRNLLSTLYAACA
jgi:hypothetical protein